VIYVHGGEWTKGDKTEVSYKPKFFTENGVVFISTNYRLYPAAKFPAHAEDVASAVRWAVDHVAEYGGDPKKIVLMGHSAGCHLVTLVGLDPKYLAAVKLKPSDLRGVVAWSGGAYDLVAKVAEGGSYKEHIGNAFGPDEAAWKDRVAGGAREERRERPAVPVRLLREGEQREQGRREACRADPRREGQSRGDRVGEPHAPDGQPPARRARRQDRCDLPQFLADVTSNRRLWRRGAA